MFADQNSFLMPQNIIEPKIFSDPKKIFGPKTYFRAKISVDPKRDLRVPPATFMRDKKRPLIDQAVNTIMFLGIQKNFSLEKFWSRKTLSIKAFKSEKSLGQIFLCSGRVGG